MTCLLVRRASPGCRALVLAVRAVALFALFALAGCQVYDPGLVQSCTPHRPPSRPTTPDGEDGPEVAFGMRDVVMAQGDRWADYGYDLDDSCTSSPDYHAECTPPNGSRASVDGPGGVDNVFGDDFFPLVALTTPDLESEARHAQQIGEGLPIVRIRGWNGQDNDPRIDLAVVQAVFGAPGDTSDTPPPRPTDPVSMRPQWDGLDWYWVRDDAFLDGDVERPFIRDDNAYVRDRVVVGRLPDRIDIIFPADDYGVLVRITGASVTGRISDDGQRMENVIVSGRWAITDLLVTARNIGICQGERDYDLLLQQMNRIADVRSAPGTGGPGAKCDAISLGVGFTGARVRIADTVRGAALADLCADRGGDGGVPSGADAGANDGGMSDSGS